MFLALLLLTLGTVPADVPPVPGLCSAPVPSDRDAPGCYKTGEIELTGAPTELYWHIYEYSEATKAEAEARRHRWAQVTQIHSRTWLYVLSSSKTALNVGKHRAVIVPLPVAPGVQIAHFAEAIFTPGMRTRVHSHPGPEAFYVVEGSQCMETPDDQQIIPAGGTYVVKGGLHIQAAPQGRRNLVLIIAPKGVASVVPGGNWTPSDFCDG